MKTPEGYRFTLQWRANTREREEIGAMLEALGNKKSAFVLAAISEYLKTHHENPRHPITLSQGSPVETSKMERHWLEAFVRTIVIEALSGNATQASPSVQHQEAQNEDELAAMVDNLCDFIL